MTPSRKSLFAIIALIIGTTAALAAMADRGNPAASTPVPTDSIPVNDTGLTISGEVVQEKVLKDGDGRVTVALSLTAPHLIEDASLPIPAADLVIVLDRSGSMEGQKLQDARQAVIRLLDQLGPDDRLALVTYSDGVQTPSALVPITANNHRRLSALVQRVTSGGGTNLGGGLKQGIDLMTQAPGAERQRKVILISDGLANQGITDPAALGIMATAAVEHRFSISTVGVGLDFNEMLMTTIADHGAGSYHFLENPQAFAHVFEDELSASRRVAATDVKIRIPLGAGVRLISAGGYPIHHESEAAVIAPGNLLSGQQRTLYLTFQVPTATEREILLGQVQADSIMDGKPQTSALAQPLTVACVPDPAAVMASIKKETWADQVVQEEFSQLKESVAADIRDGEKERAQQRIEAYKTKQAAINAVVGSSKVTQNLDTDVQALRESVDDTFAGPPAAVAAKKKQAAKSLQYDSYQKRRDKHQK
ncbi:von Willebrand factor, type A [Desulfosarcina cetonica]|nr:von Willebrand factor, type A [Desulfosarcina cetonica]